MKSIVFRLAGAEEYVNNEVFNYAADIDTYFAPYQNHPLIRYVKQIRERDEVAYNAVSGTATLLQIKNGKVVLSPHADIACFTRDPRWTEESFLTYVKLLNRFYRDVQFHTFFNRHQALYAETEKRFNAFLANIHTEWFNDFFGYPLAAPVIDISLTNGRSNYGAPASCSSDYPNGSLTIGCPFVDPEGIPVFDIEQHSHFYFTVVHELCHIHTTPLISKYKQALSQSADIIFPYVKEQLAKVAYGDAWTMISEGINNLCTNMYFREYPTGFERNMVRSNERQGFVWMRRGIKFMDNFYAHRDLYPHIADFMPQIVSFINLCSAHIDQIVFEYNHAAPYVTNVYPGLHSVVPTGVKEIRIDFSHSMHDAYGIFYIRKHFLITIFSFSIENRNFDIKRENVIIPKNDGQPYWNEDRTSLFIPVQLEKGKNYGIRLPKDIFQSSDTYPMQENFEILFRVC